MISFIELNKKSYLRKNPRALMRTLAGIFEEISGSSPHLQISIIESQSSLKRLYSFIAEMTSLAAAEASKL